MLRRSLWTVAVAALAACGSGEAVTAYMGATVWDGTGTPPILDAVIVVRGDRIVNIGPPDLVDIPRGAAEHRLDGRFVIPGLIDLHTHAHRWSLTRYLTYGVTAVRQLSGREDSVFALRDEVDGGRARGPRIFAAGALIDGPPPLVPYAFTIRNATEARRAIDSLTLMEVSWAKVYTKVAPGLLEPLMDEARTLNLPVAAHLGKVDAMTAARMGVRTIEHLTGVVAAARGDAAALFRAYDDFATGFRAEEIAWASVDSAALDRVARQLAEAGVALVPTLTVHELVSRLTDAAYVAAIDNGGVPAEIRRQYTPASTMRQLGLSTGDLAVFRSSRDRQDLFVRRFAAHGGLIGAGTDSPTALVPPGASLHQELALFVAAGLSNEQALLAATRDAARILNAATLGTLQAGSAADFLVLEANPLQSIRNVATVHTVVSQGERYSPNTLRREWRP
jgi:imidazolonepropionase-like amidohydrolase